MNKYMCGNCKYYSNKESYPDTGYCNLYGEFVDYDYSCDDYDDEVEE